MAGHSTYKPETGERICEEIAQGRSLIDICKEMGINPGTVLRWRASFPEFAALYSRARATRAELAADQVIPLADSANPVNATAVRLQVEARRWYASRLLAQEYGDKVQHTGEGGGPIQLVARLQEARQRLARADVIEAETVRDCDPAVTHEADIFS